MAEFGPPPPITKDELIDVLRRNFEGHWIGGLISDPTSFSIFEGLIAQILRIQDVIDENVNIGGFILTAPGRAPATSTVRLFRAGGGAEVVLTTELRFLDNRGQIWRPTIDFTIPFSGVDQTVDVPIRTDRSGYFLNTFEPLTYSILDVLPDPSLIVLVGSDPAVGGKTPFLDQHGKERREFRAPIETDTLYRQRIRFIEDQVSPRAIVQTLIEVLDAYPSTKPIVDLIVIHGISLPPGEYGGHWIDDFFCNCLDPAAHDYFREIHDLQVSSHLLIRRDGRIHQYVPLTKRAWHAGESSFQERSGCNDFSIGIELEGSDETPYTGMQYNVLAEVILELMRVFPDITAERVVGHSDIAPQRKTDPGPAFDWARLHTLVESGAVARFANRERIKT